MFFYSNRIYLQYGYDEYLIIRDDTKVPNEIKQFIKKWKLFFKDLKDFEFYICSLKYTALTFKYEDKLYVIIPETLEISQETHGYEFEQIFDWHFHKMSQDLEKIGATDFGFRGMID